MTSVYSNQSLTAIFGQESFGVTPSERAKSSRQVFIRSQHQLSFATPSATGRQLNAIEALTQFGWEKLSELQHRPSTILIRSGEEPYKTILDRAAELDVNWEKIVLHLGWTRNHIEDFKKRRQIPFRLLERLAQRLALQEQSLGFDSSAAGDRVLGQRLKAIRNQTDFKLTESIVLLLSESAWTIGKQIYLAELLKSNSTTAIRDLGFNVDPDYGEPGPTWRIGFRLAEKTRELLKIGKNDPINGLKDLVETKLGIPVIQLEHESDFAGATISNGGRRGIAINLRGANGNALVRRMTLAHELGHLLWDPDTQLNRLVVDRYGDIEDPSKSTTAPEKRANAFAIQFLAPQNAVKQVYEDNGRNPEGLSAVISTFGISKSAAIQHINNAYQTHEIGKSPHIETEADSWEGGESLGVPLFKPSSVAVTRRGRFASFVVQALDRGLISKDTVGALLGCGQNQEEINQAVDSTRKYVMS